MLWTDRRDDIHIVLGVKDQTITLYPDTSVCLYTVEIRNAKNLKDLSPFAISGSLTGLSEGFLVGRNKLDDNLMTVPFEAQTRPGVDHQSQLPGLRTQTGTPT